jgi:hypothetical protein
MGINISTDYEGSNEKLFVFDFLVTSLEQKAILVPKEFTIEQAISYAKENADKMSVPNQLDPEIVEGKPMFGDGYECCFSNSIVQERIDDLTSASFPSFYIASSVV